MGRAQTCRKVRNVSLDIETDGKEDNGELLKVARLVEVRARRWARSC